jgi:hypothetical protein
MAISPILAASIMECIRTNLSLQLDPKKTLLWTEMDNQITTQSLLGKTPLQIKYMNHMQIMQWSSSSLLAY